MLPCRRGALLAKSASFKRIPEDIQIKHEIYAKINPKSIEKAIQNPSQKGCAKILKNITKNIANLAISGFHFGAVCMVVSRCGAFFFRPAFRNLCGAPPRAILDAKMKQKATKRSPNGARKGAKIMQNYLPTHYQSTQILFSAITPLRHYFFNEFKNN
jgi:hypothetical protein